MKLDLGCGSNKRDGGFTGVDISADCGADVVHDLRVAPWPFEDNSIEEVHCSHFFEHLTGAERIVFMGELWRILAPEAKATLITPYYSSQRAIQDPTHQWPPVCEASYLYFNKGWRDANKLSHYNINCDFDYTYGYSPAGAWGQREESARAFAFAHYINTVSDLFVTLIKRPAVAATEVTPDVTKASI